MTKIKMINMNNLIALVLCIQLAYAQYADNPFLNGYNNDFRAYYGDQQAYMDMANNPFLSHMISSRAIPGYAAPQYLPPVEKSKLVCSGSQYCVNANQCVGGYFSQGSRSRQDCDSDTEVCCTYRPPPPPPPPPTQKPSTPCTGNNYACVPPNLCQNGQVASSGFQKTSSSTNCYAPEVCCRIPPPKSTELTKDGYVVRVPENPLPTPAPTRAPTRAPTPAPRVTTVGPSYLPPTNRPPPQKGEELLSEPIYPTVQPSILPSRCAAAMNCTDVQFCTATGFISKTPVVLTKEQEIYRVPLTDCRDASTGVVGKCCRDPDYTDPWPTSMLGRYDPNIFGDGKYNPGNNGNGIGAAGRATRSQATKNNRLVRSQTGSRFFQTTASTSSKNLIQTQTPKFRGQCTTRDFNASPKGPGPIDAAFGEYPWQAMVLLDSTKSLLCGGVIVADDVVATAGHCVQGRKPYDVAIKGGEWKLGSDEEPLKFQIIRVRKIEFSPYNDFALLLLDTKLKFDRHIAPICIDDTPPSEADQCVTTGWGKEALRVHLQDAIMHHSQVSIISTDQQSAIIYGQTINDACEVDPGSALACANSQGQYVLKGVYSKEEGCGSSVVSFTVPDLKWMNSILGEGKVVAKKSSYYSSDNYKGSASSISPVAVAYQPQPQQSSYSQAAYNQYQSYYEPNQYRNYYLDNYYPNYANYYRQY